MKISLKTIVLTTVIFFVALAWAANRILDRHPNALNLVQEALLGKSAPDRGVNSQPPTTTNADKTTPVANPDEYWMNRIRKGGLILHFRHWQRDKSMDPAMFDSWEINNGLNAREEFFGFSTCLLDTGIAEGKIVNLLFKHAGIKVAKVISSPSCRAIESAEYGFGRVDEVWRSLLGLSSMPPKRWESHGKDLHNKLMNIEIPTGSNIVLTGHKSTFSRNSKILFAEPPTIGVDDRKQGGLLVIERTEKGLVARHVYKSIYNYTVQLMDYTVN